MACACKGKKNVNVSKTPIKNSRVSNNGKTNSSNNGKRIIRREIK